MLASAPSARTSAPSARASAPSARAPSARGISARSKPKVVAMAERPKEVSTTPVRKGKAKKPKRLKKFGAAEDPEPWADEQRAVFDRMFAAAFSSDGAASLADCQILLHTGGAGEHSQLVFTHSEAGARYGWHCFVLQPDGDSGGQCYHDSFGPGEAARERLDECQERLFATLESHWDTQVLEHYEALSACALGEAEWADVRREVFPFVEAMAAGEKAVEQAHRQVSALKQKISAAVDNARDAEAKSGWRETDATEAAAAAALAAATEAGAAKDACRRAMAQAFQPWATIDWDRPLRVGEPTPVPLLGIERTPKTYEVRMVDEAVAVRMLTSLRLLSPPEFSSLGAAPASVSELSPRLLDVARGAGDDQMLSA